MNDWKDYKEAADELKKGKLVTFPTETVYGVGCIFDDEMAYKSLVELKKRPPNKPISMMADSIETVKSYLDCSDKAFAVLSRFLPGEYTFLLKAKPDLYPWVTLNTGVLGLRVPASEEVRKMLREVGKPALVTSANISGEPTARRYEDLSPVFLEKTFVIDGECVSQVASTIVDLSSDDPKLIRQGNASFEEVLAYWKRY